MSRSSVSLVIRRRPRWMPERWSTSVHLGGNDRQTTIKAPSEDFGESSHGSAVPPNREGRPRPITERGCELTPM